MAPLHRDGDALERKLVERLKELAPRYAPLRVILYGSRARGDWLESSDFDLVAVSPRFGHVPFLDRSVDLGVALSSIAGVDLLCYTPEEFDRKRAEHGIVAVAAQSGRDLL